MPKRIRFLIPVVAVASMVIASAINPGAAVAAPAASAGALASCANPPDTPDVTAENRDRFVHLWSARFADNAWLKNFTALDAVPADVKAEGFHDMDGRSAAEGIRRHARSSRSHER